VEVVSGHRKVEDGSDWLTLLVQIWSPRVVV